jgi:hypothetical protein
METPVETITRCDLCGEERFRPFHEAPSLYGRGPLHIVRCERCGLLILNPRPTEQATAEGYGQAAALQHAESESILSSYLRRG